ncbi:MAG TPA: hypothetical protein VIH18_28150 [Candidatus Binatia bacterium]|jgi:hypothetical protein
MPVVRISRGTYAPAAHEKIRARLIAADALLAPELKKLRGMRHYYAAIDAASGTMVNVSVWDSLEDARQMDGLVAMQSLAKEFIALGVEFERPILNHEIVWEH